MEKQYTISDIAHEVGVSTTTISRFLSGQYHYMSKETKNRIEETIDRLGYRPNLIARGLKANRSFLIGVIMPQVHNAMSGHSVRGICLACAKSDYSPIIVSIENNTVIEPQKIRELLDHRVDGILTFTGSNSSEYLSVISSSGIPVVSVDRCMYCDELDSVSINHHDIVYKGLTKLVEDGATQIAMLTSRSSMTPYSTVNIRRNAYYTFIADSHMKINEYPINDLDNHSIRSALRNFMNAYPNDRKAIFIPSISNLSTVDWICRLDGMRCPEDLMILGYSIDGMAISSASKLLVISQPIVEMCTEALNLLIKRINSSPGPTPEHRTLSAKLIWE